MIRFKSSLAHRIFNFAVKIEKMTQDISKSKNIDEFEKLATLHKNIEESLNSLFSSAKDTETMLKIKKKEATNE